MSDTPTSAAAAAATAAVATATVATASGSRYLQQLCKHWAHKFEVSFTPEHGEIALPLGRCVLDATADALAIRLAGEPGADMARFREVVEEHIRRFAFREALAFDWVEATAS